MSFYVTLPSNQHSDNTPSHYRVTLDKALHLDGQWEVGLFEITILRNIKTINDETIQTTIDKNGVNLAYGNILKEHQSLHIKELKWNGSNYKLEYDSKLNRFVFVAHSGMVEFNKRIGSALGFKEKTPLAIANGKILATSEPDTNFKFKPVKVFTYYSMSGYTWDGTMFVSTEISLPSGYYRDPETLMQVVNKSFNTKCIDYDKLGNRFISLKNMKLGNGLNHLLGFHGAHTRINEHAVLPPMLNRGIYALYVYSNICETSLVGNMQVPLLRAVSLKPKSNYGDIENTKYINIMYVPVSLNYLTQIEIDIRDDTGKRIPFAEGRTTLVLHFRHKH